MKHKTFVLLFILYLFWGLAKTNAQENTLAAGGNALGSTGQLSYSVGQVDYIYASGSGGTANQGVQQPYEIYLLAADDYPNIDLTISVYPNPAINHVHLKLNDYVLETLQYQLFDLHGRVLLKQRVEQEITEIPMESFAAATYILYVYDQTSIIKSFKIIKK